MWIKSNRPNARNHHLLMNQICALTLASHFRLRRLHSRVVSSGGIRFRSLWRSCWYAHIPPVEFFASQPKAIRSITIRKLWEKNYLDGIPDGVLVGSDDRNTQGVYLVASEAGKAVLEQIRAETGIYYDIDTFQLVHPKRRSRKASARRAEHEDYCLKSKL
jgi:hypothetical protein